VTRAATNIVFIDASVLIAAARGAEDIAHPALGPAAGVTSIARSRWSLQASKSDTLLEALDNPSNSFASSLFVRLEVLPKALFHKRRSEVDFYRAYFSQVDRWAAPTGSVVQSAYREAVR
jgi:hypothetical protein